MVKRTAISPILMLCPALRHEGADFSLVIASKYLFALKPSLNQSTNICWTLIVWNSTHAS